MTRRVREIEITLLAVMQLVGVAPALTAPTEPESISQISLTELLVSRFGNLSLAERRLVAATEIGETVDCTDLSGDNKMVRGDLFAWLCTNPQATAQLNYQGISVSGAEIIGYIDLRWARVSFPIIAVGCVFSGDIDLSNSHIAFSNLRRSSVHSLNANAAKFDGNVFLSDGFKADGGVNLTSAKIDGQLDCDGGQFSSKDTGPALQLNDVEVKENVFLSDGFKADGGVDLTSAKIDGQLNCIGGQFSSKDTGPALRAIDIEVKGHVLLRKRFKADGTVDLSIAKIGGNLECDGGQFTGNDKALAIQAANIKVDGSVYLRNGFKADGRVSFFGGYVGRDFEWAGVESPEKAMLDLRLAKVGTLLNPMSWANGRNWPNQGSLDLDGFIYDQINDSAPPKADAQRGWLELQPYDRFRSQPFEQLASVFRKMGLEEDAREVMIAKNIEHARYVQGQPEWLWYGLFGHLIGYGYSPWRGFGISLGVILLGWAVFRRGYCRGLITPTGETKYDIKNNEAHPVSKDYPKFNAFVYSLETFVPLVKMGVADHWEPNSNRDAFFVEKSWLMTGGCLRGYMWFHMIAGWILSALWVGGITGLVKT